ncbi:MAG: neutral/alkaline non-lysosomal ceramidase N-terminal domain-containing protein, partial [Saprospiraceae bacterium]
FHKMKGVKTPIFARTIIIENNDKKIAFVNLEIGFCTIYLKNGIIRELIRKYPELNLKDENIMITAQHTHSAGGGITQHFFYNIPTPGFQEDVYNFYRDKVVECIAEAAQEMKEVSLEYGTGEFHSDKEVAFNRSLESYNANSDVSEKLKKEDWHLAADRIMKLMQFKDAEGNILASLNWFGTHGTSISNDLYYICSDNKGYAATNHEKALKNKKGQENSISIFAQEACGDISPNFIYDRKKGWTRGKYKDDYESAEYTGNLQKDKAEEISKQELNTINGGIKFAQSYVEFSNIDCLPEFTGGQENRTTTSPCWGMSFFEGTVEGPGMPKFIGNIVRFLMKREIRQDEKKAEKGTPEFRAYLEHLNEMQAPKLISVDGGRGKFFMDEDVTKMLPLGFIDASVTYIKNAGKNGFTEHKPWVGTRLPVQLFTIGEIAIAGFSTEITTVAGRRLRASILADLKPLGIKSVILSPYANGYAGYVTTPEEYEIQAYEAGHTLFGKWTLPALQTAFRKVADQLINDESDNSTPLIFEKEMIWKYK